MKEHLPAIAITLLCVVIVLGGFVLHRPTADLAGQFDRLIPGGGSASSVTVNTTTTLVLEANSNRHYAQICNTTNNLVYCTFGPSATTSQGVLLAGTSTGSFCLPEAIGPGNPWSGPIACIAGTQSDVTVQEY